MIPFSPARAPAARRDAARIPAVRAALLAVSLLAGGAATDPPSLPALSAQAGAAGSAPAPNPPRRARFTPTGAFGAYLDGRFAMSQSEPDVAAAAFMRALATDPANAELIQQAFAASLMTGRPEAARLARQLPENPVAQLLLADGDARAGRWDAAENRFRGLPSQGPVQVLHPLLIAWSQQGAGRTEAALGTLRPWVDGQRFRAVYALHAALIADLGGRTADAARFYKQAQAEYGGTNLRLAQILANWHMRQGQPAESREAVRALSDGGDDMSLAVPALTQAASGPRPVPSAADGIAESYVALAAALRHQDATDFATLLLRLALDLRPDLTAARLLLADIMEGNRRPALALQTLAAVQPADPLYTLVRLRRAQLAERMGNTEEALRVFEQIARDHPESPLPLARQGDILRGKQRLPDAITAYDKAIARVAAPTRAAWPLFYARGIAHERNREWTKAEADFNRALELSPDQPFVLNYLGYSWADQGINLDQARRMIERAAEQRPNDGAIVDSLGWVMLRQGEVGTAIRLLERAVELQPEDSTINGHLGDAYWAGGRKREADFQWRRALTLNPDPADAAKLEARLNGNGPQSEAAAAAAADRSLQ